MTVRLRLTRVGKKKQPAYRIVAADSRSPRDGRFIEIVGQYNPRTEPSVVTIDNAKAVKWLMDGAQPSDRVKKLLEISGAWSAFGAARARQVVAVGANGSSESYEVPKLKPELSGGREVGRDPRYLLEHHGDLWCLSWGADVPFRKFASTAAKLFGQKSIEEMAVGEPVTFARFDWQSVAVTWHEEPLVDDFAPQQLGAIFEQDQASLVIAFVRATGGPSSLSLSQALR